MLDDGVEPSILLAFGGWALPWDDSVLRPLPDRVRISSTDDAGTVPP